MPYAGLLLLSVVVLAVLVAPIFRRSTRLLAERARGIDVRSVASQLPLALDAEVRFIDAMQDGLEEHPVERVPPGELRVQDALVAECVAYLRLGPYSLALYFDEHPRGRDRLYVEDGSPIRGQAWANVVAIDFPVSHRREVWLCYPLPSDDGLPTEARNPTLGLTVPLAADESVAVRTIADWMRERIRSARPPPGEGLADA